MPTTSLNPRGPELVELDAVPAADAEHGPARRTCLGDAVDERDRPDPGIGLSLRESAPELGRQIVAVVGRVPPAEPPQRQPVRRFQQAPRAAAQPRPDSRAMEAHDADRTLRRQAHLASLR
jgi:hypothetical protein